MNKILAQVAVTLTVASLGCLMTEIKPAQAITFALNWTGGDEAYFIKGFFSYDETKNYAIVTKNELTSFDFSAFDPDGNLLATYLDNHLNYSLFNFNFDTATQTILQTADGRFGPTGFQIGMSPGGYILYSAGHLPIHQHFHFVPLDDPNGATSTGEHRAILFSTNGLQATLVPEPSFLLGLGLFSLAGLYTKKRQ